MKSFKHPLLFSTLFLSSFFSSFIYTEEQEKTSSFFFENQLFELKKVEKNKECLHQLFDCYWDWSIADNPETASYLGYPGLHGEWSDFSEETFTKREVILSQFLSLLESIEIEKLEETDQISYQILKGSIKEDLANINFGSHYLAVSQMDGAHLSVPFFIDIMPHQTVQEYEEILSRLSRIPKLFEQTITLLEKGIELGITPPQIALFDVPQQIFNQIVEDPRDSSLLKYFYELPSTLDTKTQERLLDQAQKTYQETVKPSWIKLYDYLTKRYIPNCRKTIAFTELPNGNQWYAHLVESSTTTSLTPENIHHIGLKEVERIHNQMIKIIESTGFLGTFDEFLEFMKTDPHFFYSTRSELLEGYRRLTREIESRLPLLFSDFPALPFDVIPIPAYSEESQIAAYYCPGSVSNGRPGYFFINTSYPEERPKWEMEPLALHEAVPGHHMQISLAQELKHLPKFQKNSDFTAYIEGWGLYAESLGSELGFYRDPYSLFGRLSYEMLRAIRLVVDTGMHTMGWSREQAVDFFKAHVGMSDHEIKTEVDRYLVMPSQALAYKIGELKIQEMRRLAAEQLGDRFDIREFHRVWLKHGTVPLHVAEQQVLNWIEHSLQSPSAKAESSHVEDTTALYFVGELPSKFVESAI
ncbi:MAG: DUF885 domain-containing protein [Parachlamydiaceae bacterium]